MRIQEFIEQVKKKISKDFVPVVVLNNKPLAGFIDADNEEGWVDVPDLVPARADSIMSEEPSAPVSIDIKPKRIKGKVWFAISIPKAEQ